MRFVLFYHSLVSDWNHGNAHFLRGIASELLERGHEVIVYEPADAWSVQNLVRDHGKKPLRDFARAFPHLRSIKYVTLDLDQALDGADVVIVHEWSDHDLVRRIGRHRARRRSYRLLFHDTHHRAATQPKEMAAYDLSHYDGVLAYGNVIRDIYLRRGWTRAAWTWHEAADTRVFYPRGARAARPPSVGVSPADERPAGRPARAAGTAAPRDEGDVVWIGNWGDDERRAELRELLVDPIRDLKLRGKVHGVRYPDHALAALRRAGIEYGGWLPNWRAPLVFARYRLTVHVPRRPYVKKLPGIPTIRPFEALACGIPLISAPWNDAEGLFTPGEDFLVAKDGKEMRRHMRDVLNDPELANELAQNGLTTIKSRHTCAHRVTELMKILATFNRQPSDPATEQPTEVVA